MWYHIDQPVTYRIDSYAYLGRRTTRTWIMSNQWMIGSIIYINTFSLSEWTDSGNEFTTAGTMGTVLSKVPSVATSNVAVTFYWLSLRVITVKVPWLLVVDVSSLSLGWLPHLTYWNLIWFDGTPNFRITPVDPSFLVSYGGCWWLHSC